MVSEQWFVRMESLAAPALLAVEDGRMELVPARFGKIYAHWLRNIQARRAAGSQLAAARVPARPDWYTCRRRHLALIHPAIRFGSRRCFWVRFCKALHAACGCKGEYEHWPDD